eukprot:IDg21708t1
MAASVVDLTYFEIIGIPIDVSQEDNIQAFRTRAKQVHLNRSNCCNEEEYELVKAAFMAARLEDENDEGERAAGMYGWNSATLNLYATEMPLRSAISRIFPARPVRLVIASLARQGGIDKCCTYSIERVAVAVLCSGEFSKYRRQWVHRDDLTRYRFPLPDMDIWPVVSILTTS